MNQLIKPISFCLVLVLSITKNYSQDSLSTVNLEQVFLKSSKIKTLKEKLPLAITLIDFSKKQDSKQQLTFNDYLSNVPGLFSLNANNYAQDLRVSIRGFGARSAFGIRGVKIIVDGIPETTPDGQGQIDNLNLGAIKNIEVVRGPSSLLYGNASGGVISINTIDTVEKNYVNGGISSGSYNMSLYQIGFGIKTEKTNYIFQSNQIKTDGFRAFSGFKNTNVNGRIFHSFKDDSKLNFNLNYTNSPFAEDAGSLNAETVRENRRQARQRNIDFDTQEAISQLKLGLNYTNDFSKKLKFNTNGFFSTRNFYGKLPFEFGGIIDLDRVYYGHGSNLSFESLNNKNKNTLQIGYELAFQNDKRQRFRNLEGTQGEQTLNQNELFNNIGVYALDHFTIGKLLLRAGIRYDINTLKAEDDFLNNGDDSGNINLNALNYSLGINYNITKGHYLYTGISTSFETPVLSELSSNPNGGGFNENLEAQEAINYEIGYKLNKNSTKAEIALFYILTENDIVPFELEAFPDRDFFRNAGSSTRKGVEVFVEQKIDKNLSVNTSYTYSEFKYKNYELPSGDFRGKLLPGIPKHKISFSTNFYNKQGLFIALQGQHVGSLYTNDSNSVKVKPYTVLNLNFKYDVKVSSIKLIPFFGLNNLLNTKYNDNIRINAFGGRYFEPAPEFNVYMGLRVRV